MRVTLLQKTSGKIFKSDATPGVIVGQTYRQSTSSAGSILVSERNCQACDEACVRHWSLPTAEGLFASKYAGKPTYTQKLINNQIRAYTSTSNTKQTDKESHKHTNKLKQTSAHSRGMSKEKQNGKTWDRSGARGDRPGKHS